ncbi:MAG: zinc-ribbon domain-containing protein [Lachnospiraceae bacterium]|nr:zinc-ribbon domain-containing protein [Lachnospiraceae bacterium]
MHCSHCGQELQPDSVVCNNCGASVGYNGQQQQNTPYQAQHYQGTQNQRQQYYNHNQMVNIPESHKPIGAWGYIGYNLLFSIPLVGIIMLFVFSFGGTGNINLRNYSRSFLLVILIAVILWLLFAVLLFGLIGIESLETMY